MNAKNEQMSHTQELNLKHIRSTSRNDDGTSTPMSATTTTHAIRAAEQTCSNSFKQDSLKIGHEKKTVLKKSVEKQSSMEES